MKLPFILLLSLFCVSCAPDPAAYALAKQKNEESLKNPEIVGTLPDGRTLSVVIIDRPNARAYHYIYFVNNPEGGQTISINHTEREGKVDVHHVEVKIDDHVYKMSAEK